MRPLTSTLETVFWPVIACPKRISREYVELLTDTR